MLARSELSSGSAQVLQHRIKLWRTSKNLTSSRIFQGQDYEYVEGHFEDLRKALGPIQPHEIHLNLPITVKGPFTSNPFKLP